MTHRTIQTAAVDGVHACLGPQRGPGPGVTLPPLPREPAARYEALVAIASAVVEQLGEVTARALAAAIDEAADASAH